MLFFSFYSHKKSPPVPQRPGLCFCFSGFCCRSSLSSRGEISPLWVCPEHTPPSICCQGCAESLAEKTVQFTGLRQGGERAWLLAGAAPPAPLRWPEMTSWWSPFAQTPVAPRTCSNFTAWPQVTQALLSSWNGCYLIACSSTASCFLHGDAAEKNTEQWIKMLKHHPTSPDPTPAALSDENTQHVKWLSYWRLIITRVLLHFWLENAIMFIAL